MVRGAAHPTITMHVANASIAFFMINRPFSSSGHDGGKTCKLHISPNVPARAGPCG
jgi:hypothetical protein